MQGASPLQDGSKIVYSLFSGLAIYTYIYSATEATEVTKATEAIKVLCADFSTSYVQTLARLMCRFMSELVLLAWLALPDHMSAIRI